MEGRAAFEALYREHYRAVLRYAERRIADREAARDVCAETFAIAWRKFDPAEPFALPWLYRTAGFVLRNLYRRNDRERELHRMLAAAIRTERDAHRGLDLEEFLATLGPPEQEALRLTYWEGLSAAEVGEVLGCSEAAAWKRISRAKAALRRALAAEAAASRTAPIEEVAS